MMRERALSLIEVILAIVILGLAVPPLMIQLGTAMRAQTASTLQLDRIQLASERLSEIMADAADPTRGYDYVTTANYPEERNISGFKGFARQTTVREVDPSDHLAPQLDSGVKRIRVTTTGPDGNTLTVETFVARLESGGGPTEELQDAGDRRAPRGHAHGRGQQRGHRGRGNAFGRGRQ